MTEYKEVSDFIDQLATESYADNIAEHEKLNPNDPEFFEDLRKSDFFLSFNRNAFLKGFQAALRIKMSKDLQ